MCAEATAQGREEEEKLGHVPSMASLSPCHAHPTKDSLIPGDRVGVSSEAEGAAGHGEESGSRGT